MPHDVTVMLTGCGGIPAQNVLWSLRDASDRFRFVGTDCDPHKLWLTEELDAVYRVPRAQHPEYLAAVAEVIRKEDVDVVHAQPDPEVRVLSDHRDAIDARLFLPDADVVALCQDKHRIKGGLTVGGVPTARCVPLHDPGDLDRALDELGGRIWVRATTGVAGRGALPVEDAAHGRMWVDYWNGWGSFLAEEFLPGRNFAWQALYRDGERVAAIAWERLQYVISYVAPSGITGTPSASRLSDDDRVHEIGARAIAAVDPRPHGVFGVDMRESADGVPYVTEINPGRFFQPSYLYSRAGYPIVARYFELAMGDGRRTGLPVRAQVDERLHWFRGLDVAPVLQLVDEIPGIGERRSPREPR